MPKNGKLSEADKAEIKRLRDEGWPEYKIAPLFDVTPSTIRWALGKRTKPNKDKLNELDPQKFIALLRAARGRTDTVASALGVDAEDMVNWVAERVMAR